MLNDVFVTGKLATFYRVKVTRYIILRVFDHKCWVYLQRLFIDDTPLVVKNSATA